MGRVRFLMVLAVAFTLVGCSKFGRGGKGDGGMDDGSEGNIPVAEAGSEVLADVNFAYDSAALDSQAQATLQANSKWLLDNTGAKVVVEGHCDERGTEEYNLALGERRARSVYDFLRNLGVDASQISTVSYGEAIPLDPSSNESAWSKNRRAHFALNR